MLFTLPSHAEASQPKAKRVLFFSGANCGPCKVARREMEEWMRPSGWTFGDTSDCHVQYVSTDDETQADIVERYKVRLIPCFILIENELEKKRAEGYNTSQAVEVRRQVIVHLFFR
jgi:hypothetical protein